MRDEDEIRKAIAGGQRNAEVIGLMRNWCAHARAKRMGGVGMIEQMTGLPISHFAMECDHAPSGGMAAWDFGESALDFYDRNCALCTLRKPVGLPNLSRLVKEREDSRRIAAARDQIDQARIAEALEERSRARQAVRTTVNAVNQALVDDLDAFDRKHDDVDRRRLVEAARLAPERFDAKLVDLLFDHAHLSPSLARLALDIAFHVAPDERRTVLLAQRLFGTGGGGRTAGRILVANLETVKEGDLVDLVPAAAELASPDRHALFEGTGPRSSPKLLLAMWKARPGAVRTGIDRLLERKTVYCSQLAGRAMTLIIRYDSNAAGTFVRAAASRFVRAGQLLPDLGDHESLGDMAGAIDLILSLEPQALDAILQDLTVGADVEAQRNIATVYAEAWRSRYPGSKDKPHSESRLRLGLDRLAWLPSRMFDQDVLQTVAGAFRYPPDEVWPLIAEDPDKLVGAALLLDEAIADKERGQRDDTPFFDKIEWQTLHSAAYDVVEAYLKAAAKASKSHEARMRFVAAVEAIPEERAQLRGLAAKAAMQLAEDVEGLKAVLPLLYAGLVGASVLGRSHAAAALEDLPARGRQNLPALVYEAFCVLLLDQYVAVHKTAVRTLRRIALPDKLKPRAALALFQLVSAYTGSEKDDNFLMECVDELARFADHLPNPAKLRDFLCQAVPKVEPVFVRSRLRGLRHWLGKSDDFPILVAHVLPQYARNPNGRAIETDLVNSMTAGAVLKHRDRLVGVAKELAESSMCLAALLADRLYRAGARDEAIALLDDLSATYAQTVRDARRALFVGFPLLAYRMEQALASGDQVEWARLAGEWDKQTEAQRALLEDERARDSRSRFSIPH